MPVPAIPMGGPSPQSLARSRSSPTSDIVCTVPPCRRAASLPYLHPVDAGRVDAISATLHEQQIAGVHLRRTLLFTIGQYADEVMQHRSLWLTQDRAQPDLQRSKRGRSTIREGRCRETAASVRLSRAISSCAPCQRTTARDRCLCSTNPWPITAQHGKEADTTPPDKFPAPGTRSRGPPSRS